MATAKQYLTEHSLVEILAIVISHPKITTQRIINSPLSVTATVDGSVVTFTPGALEFALPAEEPDRGNQGYQIKIDDADGQLLIDVEKMLSDPQPITAQVLVFYERDLQTTPAPASTYTLTINDITHTNGVLTAQAVGMDYLKRPFPPNRYLIADFPQLQP